jgi:hypothetical protein
VLLRSSHSLGEQRWRPAASTGAPCRRPGCSGSGSQNVQFPAQRCSAIMKVFSANNVRWKCGLLVLMYLTLLYFGTEMAGWWGPVEPSRRYSPEFLMTVGWLMIVLSVQSGAWTSMRFWNTQDYIRIGPDGILHRGWSTVTIPWSEIHEISRRTFRKHRVIMLHLIDRKRFPRRGWMGRVMWLPFYPLGHAIELNLGGTDQNFDAAMSAIKFFASDKQVVIRDYITPSASDGPAGGR